MLQLHKVLLLIRGIDLVVYILTLLLMSAARQVRAISQRKISLSKRLMNKVNLIAPLDFSGGAFGDLVADRPESVRALLGDGQCFRQVSHIIQIRNVFVRDLNR